MDEDNLDLKKIVKEISDKVKKNETKIKILSDIIDRQQILINNNLVEISALRSYITENLNNT